MKLNRWFDYAKYNFFVRRVCECNQLYLHLLLSAPIPSQVYCIQNEIRRKTCYNYLIIRRLGV